MADYHVRNISKDGRKAVTIFHIPVPNENNSAGVSLRTAISEWIKPVNTDGSFGTFQSQLQNISTQELTQLQTGELFEVAETVGFLSDDTNLQKQAKLDARFTSLSTNGGLDKIRTILKFWGKDRDVT